MSVVRLGQDVQGGGPAVAPLGHLAVFGQTRRAGKTTSLRTWARWAAEDLDAAVVVFRTGRGEIDFGGRYAQPFFRERLDWKSVEAMLWSFLAEKPKVYRPIIMRAVHGARSLEDVHRAIVAAGKKSRNGWVQDRTYELDQYFQELLPFLRQHGWAKSPAFHFGTTTVVDLEGWPATVQQLVVAATLEALLTLGGEDAPVLVILPEGRNFIPSDRATPAKLAADHFAREGAKLNLFLWVDSQSLTGVDQLVLRNFALQLQGVQTSDIEIRRVAKAFEVAPKRIHELRVGDFLLRTDEGVGTIHVPLEEPKQEEIVDEKERKGYEDRISNLENAVRVLEETNARQAVALAKEHDHAEANARAAASSVVSAVAARAQALHDAVDRAQGDGESRGAARERADLHVFTETPDLTLHVKVVRIDANEDDYTGKLAKLLTEGFFDDKQSTGPIGKEFAARGWGNPIAAGGGGGQALRAALRQLCAWGFLREFNGMFGAVLAAKARIRVQEEAA